MYILQLAQGASVDPTTAPEPLPARPGSGNEYPPPSIQTWKTRWKFAQSSV
jgi:hypothetical protein